MHIEDQGYSWALHSSGCYYHKRKQVRYNYYFGHAGVMKWEPNTVIGVMIDIEKKQIRYSFDGKDDDQGGPPFVNVDIGEGVYPAISVGMNSRCEINFGRKPFAFPPQANLNYCPMENPNIQMSSWLDRYSHASDVCHQMFQRLPGTEKV
jgi:hypothetical protein